MRILQFLTMLGALMVFASCGGGTPAGTTGPARTTSATAPAAGTPAAPGGAEVIACQGSNGEAVAIQNFAYSPATVTVSLGSIVTWTNNDTAPHTVTFDSGPDCGNLANGATTSAAFAQAGTYAYHCTIHSQMRATVVVE